MRIKIRLQNLHRKSEGHSQIKKNIEEEKKGLIDMVGNKIKDTIGLLKKMI